METAGLVSLVTVLGGLAAVGASGMPKIGNLIAEAKQGADELLGSPPGRRPMFGPALPQAQTVALPPLETPPPAQTVALSPPTEAPTASIAPINQITLPAPTASSTQRQRPSFLSRWKTFRLPRFRAAPSTEAPIEPEPSAPPAEEVFPLLRYLTEQEQASRNVTNARLQEITQQSLVEQNLDASTNYASEREQIKSELEQAGFTITEEETRFMLGLEYNIFRHITPSEVTSKRIPNNRIAEIVQGYLQDTGRSTNAWRTLFKKFGFTIVPGSEYPVQPPPDKQTQDSCATFIREALTPIERATSIISPEARKNILVAVRASGIAESDADECLRMMDIFVANESDVPYVKLIKEKLTIGERQRRMITETKANEIVQSDEKEATQKVKDKLTATGFSIVEGAGEECLDEAEMSKIPSEDIEEWLERPEYTELGISAPLGATPATVAYKKPTPPAPPTAPPTPTTPIVSSLTATTPAQQAMLDRLTGPAALPPAPPTATTAPPPLAPPTTETPASTFLDITPVIQSIKPKFTLPLIRPNPRPTVGDIVVIDDQRIEQVTRVDDSGIDLTSLNDAAKAEVAPLRGMKQIREFFSKKQKILTYFDDCTRKRKITVSKWEQLNPIIYIVKLTKPIDVTVCTPAAAAPAKPLSIAEGLLLSPPSAAAINAALKPATGDASSTADSALAPPTTPPNAAESSAAAASAAPPSLPPSSIPLVNQAMGIQTPTAASASSSSSIVSARVRNAIGTARAFADYGQFVNFLKATRGRVTEYAGLVTLAYIKLHPELRGNIAADLIANNLKAIHDNTIIRRNLFPPSAATASSAAAASAAAPSALQFDDDELERALMGQEEPGASASSGLAGEEPEVDISELECKVPEDIPRSFPKATTKVKKVRGDGWCFYRTVLKGLEADPQDDPENAPFQLAQQFAQQVSDWLLENRADFEDTFNETFGPKSTGTNEITVYSIEETEIPNERDELVRVQEIVGYPKKITFEEYVRMISTVISLDDRNVPQAWPELDYGVGIAAATLKDVVILFYVNDYSRKYELLYTSDCVFKPKDHTPAKVISALWKDAQHFDLLKPQEEPRLRADSVLTQASESASIGPAVSEIGSEPKSVAESQASVGPSASEVGSVGESGSVANSQVSAPTRREDYLPVTGLGGVTPSPQQVQQARDFLTKGFNPKFPTWDNESREVTDRISRTQGETRKLLSQQVDIANHNKLARNYLESFTPPIRTQSDYAKMITKLKGVPSELNKSKLRSLKSNWVLAQMEGGRMRKNTFRRRRGVTTKKKHVRRTSYRKNRANRTDSHTRRRS